jgi:hypothetical protein
MYFSHIYVISRSLCDQVGGLRVGFEGSQDYDLALRATEKARHIGHIPLILYHWRVLPNSTASSAAAKPDSIEAGRKAVQEALLRRRMPASAYQPDWAGRAGVGIFSHRFEFKEEPSVAIVIPTKDQKTVLKKCVSSIIEKTKYRNYQIVILDNDSSEPETIAYLETIVGNPAIKVVKIGNPHGKFNFSFINNKAASLVDSEYILFLNNDVEVMHDAWLNQMVGYAAINGVGAVGARLLYPDRTIQHAGIIIKFYHGMAGHAFKGLAEEDFGYLGYTRVLRNYTAVTAACMLTPRKLFVEMGGFDESISAWRIMTSTIVQTSRKGYRIVYTPEPSWSITRKSGDMATTTRERSFQKNTMGKDRYFNPNLSLDNEFFQVEPRTSITGYLPKPVKTLMCTHNLNHEGAPYSQYEMTVGLKEKGIIDPMVLSPSDGPLRALYESRGIKVLVDEKRRNIFVAEGYRERVEDFAAFIKELGVEMVYANTLINFHAIAAAKEAGLPSVWNIRESEPWQHYINWWGSEVATEAQMFEHPYKVILWRTQRSTYFYHSTPNTISPSYTTVLILDGCLGSG